MCEYSLEQFNDQALFDVGGCCCPENYCFEEVNGVCPDCGRLTVDGRCRTNCCYSSVKCETCGASPCDGSC